MATPLGQRLLDRYAAGTAAPAQLQKALVAGWITQEEYDAATSPVQDEGDDQAHHG